MPNKTEIFIDGSNFYATIKLLGLTVDYSMLRDYLQKEFPNLVRINYYTALLQEADDQIKLKPLVDWMSYNGFNLITKPAKRHEKSDGTYSIKGNMDVEIAVGMINAGNYAHEIVLFSGDGDFVSVVQYLQTRWGAVVTIFSSLETNPRLCSDDLRKQADKFVEIASLSEVISKNWEKVNG